MNCFCKHKNDQISFDCKYCQQKHHFRCYHIQLLQQSTDLVCIQCRLKQYEPYMERFFSIRKTEPNSNYSNQYPREIKLEEFHQYYNQVKNNPNEFKVAIVCTSIFPPKNNNKNSVSPIYQWVSKNIFIEWNNEYHVKYQEFEFAYIPPKYINQRNWIKLKIMDNEHDGLMGVVVLKTLKFSSIWSDVILNQSKIVDLEQVQKKYKQRIRETEILAKSDFIQMVNFGITINLFDPSTCQQIEFAAKGINCQHIDSFDLQTFLLMNKEESSSRWKCPLCHQIIPYNEIVIDVIQQEIIFSLQRNYPIGFHKLDKVQIINEKLEYTFDKNKLLQEKSILSLSQGHGMLMQKTKFSINYQKVYQQNQDLANFIISNPNVEIINLDRKHCQAIFQEMRQYLQKIEKDEELYSIFRLLFEEEYMNESIFARKVDLCESKCVESICLEIWSDSFSGLIAEFILNSKKYINTFIPLLLKFCQKSDTQLNLEKIIEIIFAISYGVYQYQFEPYCNNSFGYTIGLLLELLYKQSTYKNCLKQNQISFFQRYVSELYLPLHGNKIVFLSKLHNAADFIRKFYKNEELEVILPQLYTFNQNVQKKTAVAFAGLLYLALRKNPTWIKLLKNWESIQKSLTQNNIKQEEFFSYVQDYRPIFN